MYTKNRRKNTSDNVEIRENERNVDDEDDQRKQQQFFTSKHHRQQQNSSPGSQTIFNLSSKFRWSFYDRN